MKPARALMVLMPFAALAAWWHTAPAGAQVAEANPDAAELRDALVRAQAQSRSAAVRAARLEASAQGVEAAADSTAREAAALAARIQQSEAGVAAAEARMGIARRERLALDRRLAERRTPLVRLTAGLQRLARRPLAVAILRPGSLRDTVYLRAMLDASLPEVRRRTAAVRAELARARQIEADAERAALALAEERRRLAARRQELAALESRQRLASRAASGAAAREAERALALGEQARDLDSLAAELDRAGSLRRELAALPGPTLRPSGGAGIRAPEAALPVSRPATLAYQLPVAGRIVSGFGMRDDSGSRTRGIALAGAQGAQVVAPAAGRVAFAGPFRGFDRIVIIEHAGGYTSLVTGLARVDVAVGETLVGGAPLGVAGAGTARGAVIGLELRKDGTPVNPALLLR
ncbi:peptidoglycan DD-metalloendopeptidase family protein [Altererythrobacter aerius]|uniref:Peptidoglycan DD-metalloendopeptidase family protein n=1 Tax=Tsuneonella aeria TaxID=1837929 RepID=A0A6I4TFQ2_9SPHN|nr:peptidoglycan DD-metalloendopeptidase family protein [Tsuneonella aeria]MXO75476.1 peptidoglycan DD-metalloendopeptidase family protein [Tsuneonella aeria]